MAKFTPKTHFPMARLKCFSLSWKYSSFKLIEKSPCLLARGPEIAVVSKKFVNYHAFLDDYILWK